MYLCLSFTTGIPPKKTPTLTLVRYLANLGLGKDQNGGGY